MKTEIKSKLDARGFAVEVIATAGHIVGNRLDIGKVIEVEKFLIEGADLPETESDVFKSIIDVRAFALETLVTLAGISGLSVSTEQAEIITKYIIGDAPLK